MLINLFKSKKGFTILELIIALLLVTIISTTSFLLLRITLNFWEESFSSYQLENQLLYAFDQLSEDLRWAEEVRVSTKDLLKIKIKKFSLKNERPKLETSFYYLIKKQKKKSAAII